VVKNHKSWHVVFSDKGDEKKKKGSLPKSVAMASTQETLKADTSPNGQYSDLTSPVKAILAASSVPGE